MQLPHQALLFLMHPLSSLGTSLLEGRACDSYCAADNQYCCTEGQACYTNAQNIAYCSGSPPVPPRACDSYCSFFNQLCCTAGQACYTNAHNIAYCSNSPVPPPPQTGWEFYTMTYTETDLILRTTTCTTTYTETDFILRTSTFGSWIPLAMVTSASYTAAFCTIPCGSICCVQDQRCAAPNQCTFYVSSGSPATETALPQITPAICAASLGETPCGLICCANGQICAAVNTCSVKSVYIPSSTSKSTPQTTTTATWQHLANPAPQICGVNGVPSTNVAQHILGTSTHLGESNPNVCVHDCENIGNSRCVSFLASHSTEGEICTFFDVAANQILMTIFDGNDDDLTFFDLSCFGSTPTASTYSAPTRPTSTPLISSSTTIVYSPPLRPTSSEISNSTSTFTGTGTGTASRTGNGTASGGVTSTSTSTANPTAFTGGARSENAGLEKLEMIAGLLGLLMVL